MTNATRGLSQLAQALEQLDAALQRLRCDDAELAVACSGGTDSAALAFLLAKSAAARGTAPPRLLHVNHHWSDDSARLQASAEELAATLNVRIDVRHLNPNLSGERLGREGAARRARYAALAAMARPSEVVALAHHSDDRVETLLLKLAQGAGLGGLAGPRERFDAEGARFVRPVLELSRRTLREIAAAAALPREEDPSNADHSLLRNAVRDLVVPPLTSVHGAAALRRSGAVVASDARAFTGALDALLDRLHEDVMQPAGAIALPAADLAELPNGTRQSLLRRAWHRVGVTRPDRGVIERTDTLTGALPGVDIAGPSCRAERWWHHVVLAQSADPRQPLAPSQRRVLFDGGQAAAGGFRVRMSQTLPELARFDAETAEGDAIKARGTRFVSPESMGPFAFDAQAIDGDVTLRLAGAEEQMSAFGRERAEPVSRLLDIAATPAWRRANCWVIADQSGPLLVCGGRRSDRAPITRATRQIIEFHVDCA